MRIGRTLILVAAVAVVCGAPALAFHDDGVAHCNGCHTMHNSEDGDPMNFNAAGTGFGTPTGTGYPDLLLYANKTDVCLDCHDGDGGYHVWSVDPDAPSASSANRGGGDFVFLEETNINDGHGGAGSPILGHASGHNVISAMRSSGADPELATSPGGAYPAGDLYCTSCHDPHGTDSFRLLYRNGQSTVSDTSHVINWTANIDADGISVFAGAESNGFHNAYRSGYSEWCGECHGDFHAASANLVHPSGELLDTRQVLVYNQYNGTTNCLANPPTGPLDPCGDGVFASAYLAAVPIEDPDATMFTTEGATDGDSVVACMSCHRAHATSAPNAGRWDFNITGMQEDGDESTSYMIPNPYDVGQRSLCNKCHSQDEFDAAKDFTPVP